VKYKSIIRTRSDGCVMICAWCSDYKEATQFCEEQNKDYSHGSCVPCAAKQKRALRCSKARSVKPTTPKNPTAIF